MIFPSAASIWTFGAEDILQFALIANFALMKETSLPESTSAVAILVPMCTWRVKVLTGDEVP